MSADGPPSDWAGQAADTIESVVGAVKQRATVPLTTLARAVVYGVAIAAMGFVALLLVVIALVRLVTVYLPIGHPHGHHRVWASYLILGFLFTGSGFWVWTKRNSKEGNR